MYVPVHWPAAVSDPGEGFLDGTCSGGTLTITLRTTKAVDLTTVQWAASDLASWPAGMVTCDEQTCLMSNEGKQVDIDVPATAGKRSRIANSIPWFSYNLGEKSKFGQRSALLGQYWSDQLGCFYSDHGSLMKSWGLEWKNMGSV